MNATLSPSKATYLAQVAAGLSDLTEEDRDEVLQDLEAHLAELGDDELLATLGSPEAFVAEFRASAGLDRPDGPRFEYLRRLVDRVEHQMARLSRLTQWPRFRPAWIWVRGWLLVVAWSYLYDFDQFRNFPIPSIGGSTLAGVFYVALATALSVWLAGGVSRRRRAGSTAMSALAVLALGASFANTPIQETYDEVAYYPDQLIAADGSPVTNIYAYDLEGNAVDVLLFDQAGRPLLALPTYVYEEADYNPGMESIDFGEGTVTFRRDQFGRIIPNLYPLQLSRYDQYGELNPVPPPSLGFPSVEEDETTVPTTTAPPFG